MTVVYKLTDGNGQTYGGTTQWGQGVTHHATGPNDLIHCYATRLLAVFLAPLHVSWPTLRLWEAEGEVVTNDELELGCETLTTNREIALPAITTEQRVRFGIFCGKAVYREAKWTRWANDWLSGKDRSEASAGKAEWGTRAEVLRGKLRAVPAVWAARAASHAARAATTDADDLAIAAAHAAAATTAHKRLDLADLAWQAMEEAP